MVLTNLIYSSDLSVSAQAAVSGEQRYKMAASSTADLALDDIKKADEIISMAVLGKLHICILWQYWFSSFQERDTKLTKFLALSQHTRRNLFYFVNRCSSAELSKSARIDLVL
jgi:hypothetical protein